jgi:acetoin utilization deacetylase AcuC-like enzyme
VHHGNGTAAIFTGDASVLTLSLHQYHNYPSEKPPSTIDVHLRDGVGDEEYLDRLRGALTLAMSFAPDMLYYLAGADPYGEDQLGGLSLTIEGLKQRDQLVFETAYPRYGDDSLQYGQGGSRRYAKIKVVDDQCGQYRQTRGTTLRNNAPGPCGAGESGRGISCRRRDGRFLTGKPARSQRSTLY